METVANGTTEAPDLSLSCMLWWAVAVLITGFLIGLGFWMAEKVVK